MHLQIHALANGQNALANGQNALANGQNPLANGQHTLANGQNARLQRGARSGSSADGVLFTIPNGARP